MQLIVLLMLQSSFSGSSRPIASGSFSSRGSTSTQPVSSKPPSIVGSYQTTSSYSGSDTYQTSHSQYGSGSYYSSTTTTASFGRGGSYASYQSFGSSGPHAASKQASAYTQPVGRGSYAMAGDDGSASTYSWAPGYDSGYHTSPSVGTSAAGTYGEYNESGYYIETDGNQYGYDSGGNYGNVDPSQQLYDYSSSYDSGYNSGYGSASSTTTGYGTARPTGTGYGMARSSTTTTASLMHTGGSFGRPVSVTGSVTTSSVRFTSPTASKTASTKDQYYTTAGKADPYAGYGSGDYWSTKDQSYYYGETEGGYGESVGVYDDYNSSIQVTGEEWDYSTDQTGIGRGYPGNQSNNASTGYYEPAGRGRASWSAGAAGRGSGRGTGQLAYTGTENPPAGAPTGPRSMSAFSAPHGTLSTAASAGFQAGRGGRQTTAGGTSLQTSSYGAASSSSQGAITFSSASSGYSSSWGGVGGQKSTSVPVSSQRTPRVDGFASFMSGTVSSSGATKSSATARFTEPQSDGERRPSRWSETKASTADTHQDRSRQAAGGSQYGRSISVPQPSDNGAPRVFDYGHRDCEEQQAARSSDRSFYLANVNTAKPASAAAKRTSSPSPDYRRPSSSMGSDWQTSSRRDDGRGSSRSMAAERSRDGHRSSLDTYDQRKSSSFSEKSSSSGPARHSTSYGQGSSTQGRPSQDRWGYTTESGSSSRSSSVGHRTGEPAKTAAKTVPGLMDSLYSTSSVKTAPVCVLNNYLSIFSHSNLHTHTPV